MTHRRSALSISEDTLRPSTLILSGLAPCQLTTFSDPHVPLHFPAEPPSYSGWVHWQAPN